MKQLSTTSYAILALLALRPWSAYELSQQMRRNVGEFWPRAERGIYDEPKNLVAHQLATATDEPRGRRTRTVYTITEVGREALRVWLAQPSQPPRFESEAVLRLAFAEQGAKQAALDTLAGLRAHARERQHWARLIVREYVEGQGPYPERLHVMSLIEALFADYFALLERWSTWAITQVETWGDPPSTFEPGPPRAVLERIAALAPVEPQGKVGGAAPGRG